MEDAAELLTPAEADWPPELRLPLPPPQPPPAQAMGMDDSQFLGSIMGDPPPHQQQAPAEAPVGVKRKRGRPPKNRDGAAVVAAKAKAKAKATAAAAKPARRREDEEEVVCFICFDGGNLVVCDRRGCPKVYHPACIKREESFFQSRSKWNCGWHICSSCEKAAHYMCYTCTYSVCKVCIKQGKFFSVRGTKGFCDTCFGTILLIESKDGSTKAGVDFDDQNSWEYLFKLYWLDLKGKLTLTLEELTSAKSRWNVPSTYARKEKAESSDDLYDANNDDDAGSDCSSGKRKRTNSSRKRGQKRRKANSDCSIAAKMVGIATGDAGSLPKKVSSEGVSLPVDTKWASPELLEFVGHMRDGDQSFISQFDVQTLLLDYIKQNNLRDPRRKSQIICDSRLHRLFRKTRVAHFEMLKLLETHFVVNEASTVNNDSQGVINPNSAQLDASGYSDMAAKLSPDRRRRMHRKMEREPNANLEDYAAVDMHNINLIYLRRSLMEDLIDDASFSDKIAGAFVRIRISSVGQKQDMYRLVKVIGTHKVLEKYSIGKKVTNFALEILNLDKKEIITMDTISNQDFTKEECKRLWQSMKCGLISRLKVGDVLEKAKISQSARVNDWLENEKQRLGHLRDRASETGRRKELRECVEKLQLLNTSEERTRRINEVLEVHADSHMYPDYESAEEMDDKKAVERNVNWRRSDAFFSPIKVKYSNTVQNYAQKNSDASRHPKNLSKQSTIRKSGAGINSENFRSGFDADIPKSCINVNSTMCEAASLSCSGGTLSTDMEPEKVWHYKDPSGNVQGPFTLLQLSKWTSHFPRDLRVWLTFESEERSLLLTEVLSKQPKDFSQAASVTTSIKATLAGSGQNRNIPNVDLNNTLSPVGYSMLNSSEITVQSTKYSVPERESVNSLDDRLSLSTSPVPPKDADTSNSHVQYQTKHSGFPPSPGSPCGQLDLHHDGVQPRRSVEWNNRHSSGGLWSPTMPQTSFSGQSNVESHHNQDATWSQVQHDSKSSLQAGSVKDLNSRLDYSQNLPTQRIGRDVSSPVFSWSPSESRTASSQHEGSCLSSTTNPSIHDALHSSIVSAKAKSCAPATPVEDRGSSSPSGMLSHTEGVPICCPQSAPSASASEICKMEVINQQKTLEADASNASVNQSPQSKILPESSPDNQDIEREYPSPAPRSESKEPVVDHSGSTSVAPEICKMEIMNQQKTLEADASNASVNQSPQSKIFPESSPDNQDIEREYPSPTPRSESKEPAVDHSGSTSVAPKICKMEIMNQQITHEADASNASVNQSPQYKIFPESSDNQDIEREYPSPTPRSESKEPAMDHSGSTSLSPQNLATKIPDHSPVAFVSPKSGPPTGEIGATESVSNLEKTDLKGEDSNVQKELYMESTLVTRENMVVDPASCAESIDVSDVLESLIEQSCGASYMNGTAALEDSMTASAKEEPQCSSPIALSPWGEPGYYQGDAVDSALWGVQDDPINDMWSLCSPLPALHLSSGVETDGKGTARVMNEVTVTQGNNEIVQRGQTPGEKKVELANSGVSTAWGLVEQVRSKANDESVSSMDGSMGVVGWQPSANESSNVDTAWSTSQNPNLSSSYETAAPSSRSSQEASRKQECTYLNAASSGEALGNAKSWNPSTGNANRGSQRSHHHDRYSQISESWLLSSNYSRSRSDGFGSDGSSRTVPRGQTQRGICKFHESGYCRKGASCNNMHPWSPQ